MNTKLFLEAMNDIDDKYLKKADRFSDPLRDESPNHMSPLQVFGMLAAAFLVVTGIWFIWGRNPNVEVTRPGRYAKAVREVKPSEESFSELSPEDAPEIPKTLPVYRTSDDMIPAYHASLDGGKEESSQIVRQYLQAYFDAAGIEEDASLAELNIVGADIAYLSEDKKLSVSSSIQLPNAILAILQLEAEEAKSITEENLLEQPLIKAALAEMGEGFSDPQVKALHPEPKVDSEYWVMTYQVTCPMDDVEGYLYSEYFNKIDISFGGPGEGSEGNSNIVVNLIRKKPDRIGDYQTVPYQAALEYIQKTYPEEYADGLSCELSYAAFYLDSEEERSVFAPCYKFTLQSEAGETVHYIAATEYEGEEITPYEAPSKPSAEPEENPMAMPGNVTIGKDGYLTFENQELQAIYEAALHCEPVTAGEPDPVNRVLTLTLPCYIADRYPVGDRTHILYYLYEMSYSFIKEEDGTAYLRPEGFNAATGCSEPAGVIGIYEKDGSAVPFGSGGAFHAEQCVYFRDHDSTESDLYWENLHAFINGTDRPEYSTGTVEEDASQADWKSSRLYDSWYATSEELIDGLLYSYLEQNDLLEYAYLDQGDGSDKKYLAPIKEPYSGSDGVAIDQDGYLTFVAPAFQEVCNFVSDQPPVTDGSFYSEGSRRCTRTLSFTVPHTPVAQGPDYVVMLMDKVEYGFYNENGKKTVRAISSYSGPVAVDTIPMDGSVIFQANGFWQPENGFRRSKLSESDLDSLAEFIEMPREDLDQALEQAEAAAQDQNKDLTTDLLLSYMSQSHLTGYSLWNEKAQDYSPITEERILLAANRTNLSGRNIEHWFPSVPYREALVTTEQKLQLLDTAREYVNGEADKLSLQSAVPVQGVNIDSLKITELADDLSAMRIEYSLCFKTDSPQETPCSLHEGCYKTSPGVCLEILQKADGKWKCFTEDTGALFDLDGDGERDPGAFLVDWDVPPSEIIQAAQTAAQEFVDDCLNNPEYGLTESFFTYLELVAVSKDENSFVIRVRHDFKVREGDPSISLMAGNTDLDTGKYEGYYKQSIELRVAKDEGKWSIKSVGTGGAVRENDRLVNMVLLDDRP